MEIKNKDNETKIDVLLSKMTLDEKIGQLNQVIFDEENWETLKQEIREGKVGSVILANSATAGNDKQEAIKHQLLNELQEVAMKESVCQIPLIYGRDVIHGHNTVFPIPLAMAASFNPTLIKESYECIAKEARNDGVHWTFTPMLDLSRDPRWGRCIEGPGEDPYVGMQMAKAVVEGFQGDKDLGTEKMVACAKHYIGYGASEGGRDYHKAEISDYSLRNYYLKAFKQAVDSGIGTVMNSFNEISGEPTTSSHYLLTEVLRKELGFDGFVVSDWHAIAQLVNQGVAWDEKEAAKLAINAGLDMDMVDKCYIDHMKELVTEGAVLEEVIDESVRRVLRIKMALGLFDTPYLESVKLNRLTHQEKSKALATESMVLLKNKGNILPLDKSKKQRIAVIGPMVHEKKSLWGSWTLDGIEDEIVTVLEGIQGVESDAEILYVTSGLVDEMVSVVKQADCVVLALGESYTVTGEARSVADIELPEEQKALVRRVFAMGKPMIGVMIFGRPIALEEVDAYFDAVLYAWHSGTYTGVAIGELLFGESVPSGRLPMTLPRRTGQIPIYYNAPSSGRKVNGYYGEGGCYEDCQGSPMYPFGYGKSYTQFEYSSIQVVKDEFTQDEIEQGENFIIKVTVKNIGALKGKETVQCYIHDKVASMTRPIKELKGFEKVELESGEAREIELRLGKDELGFYNKKGDFVVEPGEFEVFIGKDCYETKAQTIVVR